MAKLKIYYNYYHNKNPKNLKVRIDKNNKIEIRMKEIATVELEKGKHYVEMYRRGMANYDPIGYWEQLLEISEEENYYIYKPNSLNMNRCKFYKTTKEKMDKIIKRSKIGTNICVFFTVVLIILWLIKEIMA